MLEQIKLLNELDGKIDMSLFYSIRVYPNQVCFQGKMTTSTYRLLKGLGYDFKLGEDNGFLEAVSENGKIFFTLTPDV